MREVNHWSKLYGRQISGEECREICDNLSVFFNLLYEWDKKGVKNGD